VAAAPKPLRYTGHAEDSIAERELDRGWIEQTVRSPEWSIPDPREAGVERRFRAIPSFGGRILRVACLETLAEIRILTAFFDRDAKKPK
jgi:hypothetical protein